MSDEMPNRSIADDIWNSGWAGESTGFGGNGVEITVGPLAQQNPNEDPSEYNRRKRSEYYTGLSSHGLREDEEGNVTEKNASTNSHAPSPRELVEATSKESSYMPAAPLAAQGSERPHDGLPDAKKPDVSDFPADAKTKTRMESIGKLKGKPTVVDAKKTETGRNRGGINDDVSDQYVGLTAPSYNNTWSTSSVGSQDKLAADPFIDFVLNVAGLQMSNVGPWIMDLVENAAAVLRAAGTVGPKEAPSAIDWEDPNPFTLPHLMSTIFGEGWTSWEPETLRQEILRVSGVEDIAFDRILAVKLITNRPDIFYTNLRAAEKVTIALVDTDISPGDLEETPAEYISTAVAVHNALRSGSNTPEFSEKVKSFFVANMFDDGLVLAPSLLRDLDPMLGKKVGDDSLRRKVLKGYIDGLVNGPSDDEDQVTIQVNRLLVCHLTPIGIIAEV